MAIDLRPIAQPEVQRKNLAEPAKSQMTNVPTMGFLVPQRSYNNVGRFFRSRAVIPLTYVERERCAPSKPVCGRTGPPERLIHYLGYLGLAMSRNQAQRRQTGTA
jgi:hypothetical protein